MTETIGYTACSSNLTEFEEDEYRDLRNIFGHIDKDIVGLNLYNRFRNLEERLGKAGYFYCPYIPLHMVAAIDSGTGKPAITFKTRYGNVV